MTQNNSLPANWGGVGVKSNDSGEREGTVPRGFQSPTQTNLHCKGGDQTLIGATE